MATDGILVRSAFRTRFRPKSFNPVISNAKSMITKPLVALQLGAISSVPGLVGTLVIALVIILIARVALKIAWKITLVAVVVALVLWFAGLLGPLAGFLGFGG